MPAFSRALAWTQRRWNRPFAEILQDVRPSELAVMPLPQGNAGLPAFAEALDRLCRERREEAAAACPTLGMPRNGFRMP